MTDHHRIIPFQKRLKKPLSYTESSEPKTDGTNNSGTPEPPEMPVVQPGNAYAENDSTLVERAMKALENSHSFVVLAIRIDDLEMGFDPGNAVQNLATVIEKIAVERGWFWQRIERDLFGCFIEGGDESFSMEIAGEIRRLALQADTSTISVGIARYPTISYDKREIMNNAKKALAHAAFFGPDSTVCFDAVSLNISGDSYYQAGNLEEALKEYKLALELDPNNVNVHNSVGVCYGDKEEWDNALESFNKAIELDPNDVFALYNAGYIYMQKNEYETVLDYFERAIKIDDNIFELLFHTGRALYELGRAEEALSYLERAIMETQSPGAIVYRYFGDCNLSLGKTGEAIKAYNTALKQRPDDAHSLSALAYCYEVETINSEIALVFAENAMEIQPANGLFQHRLAMMYFNRNRLQQALDHFEIALECGHEESRAYIDSTRALIGENINQDKAASS